MRLPLFRAARAKITTSADVQAEIDRHATLLTAARQDLALLDAGRRDVLLGDDVAAIRAHEDRAAELRIAELRLTARLESLAEQAVEIAAAEAAATLEVRRADIAARAEQATTWLRQRYPEVAAEMVDALRSLTKLEREIELVNTDLAEAGRDEALHLAGVQARLGIQLVGSELNAGSTLYAGSTVSLGALVMLPGLEGGVVAPGWRPVAWS